MTERKKVTDTDTTKGNYPHKLFINRIIPEIILVVIPPVKQTTADGVAESGGTFHAVRMIISKEVVTGVSCRAAFVFKDPPVINWKDAGGMIPQDRETIRIPPRATTPVQIGTGPSISPTSIRSQDIESPRRSIVPQEVRNSNPLDASINGISSEHRDTIRQIGVEQSVANSPTNPL